MSQKQDISSVMQKPAGFFVISADSRPDQGRFGTDDFPGRRVENFQSALHVFEPESIRVARELGADGEAAANVEVIIKGGSEARDASFVVDTSLDGH